MPAAIACPPSDVVVVDTASHQLALCTHGAIAATFAVSLGKGGVGKTREGDGKTPLGEYALAAPRDSDKFYRFLLIGYPTPEQLHDGLTGSEVGIHGPPRNARKLGKLAEASLSIVDWTQGCVAVADDAAIDRIAAWTVAHHVTTVVIR